MKLSRNRTFLVLFTAGSALAAGAVAVALGLIFRGEYETEQAAAREFVIREDFTKVRKILVRKNAAQQLVTMGGGSEFLAQKWSSGDASLESLVPLDPQWRLDLHGVLEVRTKDAYVGEQEIALVQDVSIEPDFLHSEVKLNKPAERLRDYRMTTHFERDATTGNARVTLGLAQRILTDAPWFAHGIADRRVRASVDKTLANQEAAIRQLIADNIHDVPLLPLR
jgi:hypothetical protein